MNGKQRIVLIIGTALIVFMLLFPPYKTYGSGGSDSRDAGYGFILDPSTRLRLHLNDFAIRPTYGDEVYLDLPRLFIQILLIGVIAASIVFIRKSP